MRCHYTYDLDGNRHHIPGCWSVVISGDPEDCTCGPAFTLHHFESQRFNKVLAEKDDEIKGLRIEVKRLGRIIEHLKRKQWKTKSL